MKYSQLAAFLTLLVSNFGEVGPTKGTDLQEDCAGVGVLASSARHFGLNSKRRDVSRIKKRDGVKQFTTCCWQMHVLYLYTWLAV